MNKIYLVQCNHVDAPFFGSRVQTLGDWIKYFENSWIVETNLSAKQVYEQLTVGDSTTKNIFIIELNKTNYWGIMNNSLWEYLKKKK